MEADFTEFKVYLLQHVKRVYFSVWREFGGIIGHIMVSPTLSGENWQLVTGEPVEFEK